jgi:glucokinase
MSLSLKPVNKKLKSARGIVVVVGVDIGGSKVAAVRLAAPHHLPRAWREHGLHPAPAAPAAPGSAGGSGADAVAAVVAAVRAAVLAVVGDGPVGPVGLSVAGWLSADRRRVTHAANLGLRDVPLPELVGADLGCAAVMENDGNAAAWAEAGGYDGPGAVVVLSLGTGVGGGVVAGGRLLTGHGGLAGELGHLPVPGSGRDCVCGGRDCLELYASGPAIAAAAGCPDARAVVAAAAAGDRRASEALRAAAAAIAAAVRSLQAVLDPARVVLAGSVAGAALRDQVALALAGPRPLAGVTAAPAVHLSTLGPYAAAIGAAQLAAAAPVPAAAAPPDRRGTLRA